MPVNHVAIVDSKGKAVGESIGALGGAPSGTLMLPAVLLRVGQNLAFVNVDRNGFFGGTLYFESTNCSGTPWFRSPQPSGRPSLLPQTAIGLPGQTLYMEMAGGLTQTVTLRSSMGQDLFCLDNRFFSPITVTAVQAQPLVDLLTVFTPPFSLRAAP